MPLISGLISLAMATPGPPCHEDEIARAQILTRGAAQGALDRSAGRPGAGACSVESAFTCTSNREEIHQHPVLMMCSPGALVCPGRRTEMPALQEAASRRTDFQALAIAQIHAPVAPDRLIEQPEKGLRHGDPAPGRDAIVTLVSARARAGELGETAGLRTSWLCSSATPLTWWLPTTASWPWRTLPTALEISDILSAKGRLAGVADANHAQKAAVIFVVICQFAGQQALEQIPLPRFPAPRVTGLILGVADAGVVI